MIIIFVSLIGVVLAANPQPCCMGDKYTAVLKSVSGSMTVGSAKGQMADVIIASILVYHYHYYYLFINCYSVLQVRRGNRDNLGIISHISL